MTHKELEKLYDSVMKKKEANDRAEEHAQISYFNTIEDSLRQYDELSLSLMTPSKVTLRLIKGGKYESKN